MIGATVTVIYAMRRQPPEVRLGPFRSHSDSSHLYTYSSTILCSSFFVHHGPADWQGLVGQDGRQDEPGTRGVPRMGPTRLRHVGETQALGMESVGLGVSLHNVREGCQEQRPCRKRGSRQEFEELAVQGT